MSKAYRKLFFDHIPKTAGMSLHSAFSAMLPGYKGAAIFCSHAALLRIHQDKHVGGHIHFNSGEALSPSHMYCTVLRDPVDRFISEYYFHRQTAQALIRNKDLNNPMLKDWQVVSSLNMTLDDFIRLGDKATPYYSNVQCMHFAARVVDNPSCLSQSELAEAAIASLEAYDLVGCFDDLPSFTRSLAHAFDVTATDLPSLNVTHQKHSRSWPEEKTLIKMRSRNEADRALLTWAAEAFRWGASEKGLVAKRSPRDCNAKGRNSLLRKLPWLSRSRSARKSVAIKCVQCFGISGRTSVVEEDEKILVEISLSVFQKVDDVTVGIALRDSEGRLVYGTNTMLLEKPLRPLRAAEAVIMCELENSLPAGPYSITVALHKGRNHTAGCYEWKENAAIFLVSAASRSYEGYLDCKAKIYSLHE